MNLANKLTILRILLVPVFLLFIAIRLPYGLGIGIATLVFIIAALTDKLDGYIARSRNQITNFGKFMDPLADKLLVTAALVSLVEFHIILNSVATIIIAREFAVSGLRTIAASEGIILAASNWGKVKTVTQIIAIIFALLNLNYKQIESVVHITNLNNYLTIITNFTMTIAVIITIISGVDYFVNNKKIFVTDK
ncbi:MAG TPA: CDP-diacylglycerol--glycerol-3-phosphate 3-phosphatidyltransferase [Clostridiaceae bacterium]